MGSCVATPHCKISIISRPMWQNATIWKINHASSHAWQQEHLQHCGKQPCRLIMFDMGYRYLAHINICMSVIICAHVIFQQTHRESNYRPTTNRADLDVYVCAQVGKGLAKLKTAQNIAIISHLDKYDHIASPLPFPGWGRIGPFCRGLGFCSTKWLWYSFHPTKWSVNKP